MRTVYWAVDDKANRLKKRIVSSSTLMVRVERVMVAIRGVVVDEASRLHERITDLWAKVDKAF